MKKSEVLKQINTSHWVNNRQNLDPLREIFINDISHFVYIWCGLTNFIPLSSKVDKYKKIVDTKMKNFGRCDTILIREILCEESAII